MYCGLDTLEVAMYDAVANNNYGRKALLGIYEHLIMIPGEFTSRMCKVLNVRRKYNVAHHNAPVTKKQRKVLRGEKKKKWTKMFEMKAKAMNQVEFRWIL